jgi:hypothetical protein
MEYSTDLFRVTKVINYDESYATRSSYKFCRFSSEVLNMKAEQLSEFVDKTVSFLTRLRDAVAYLKSIDISEIEKDLDPKVYKLILDHKITNIYELRMNIHRRHTGEIYSRIIGVAKVKGEQIVKVMEAKGYMLGLYTTEKWDVNESN